VTALALATAVVGSLVTTVASADEPQPPPERPRAPLPEQSARGRLALVGAGTAVAWYGGAVGMSYLWSDAPEASKLRIPVAGPWITLAHTGCPQGQSCSTFLLVLQATLNVLDGVGQAGGLGIVAESLFLPTSTGTEPSVPRASSARANTARLHALPYADERGMGLQLLGSF